MAVLANHDTFKPIKLCLKLGYLCVQSIYVGYQLCIFAVGIILMLNVVSRTDIEQQTLDLFVKLITLGTKHDLIV